MASIPLKTCTTCGATRPMTPEHWRLDKRYRCGYMSRCRECQRRDARKYRERHLEWKKAQVKAWYAANPDANARHCRMRWAKHKDTYNANRRAKRAADPETHKRKGRDYYRRNRHKVLAWNRVYELRKAGVKGSHTPEDIQALLHAQRGRCHWCGKPCGSNYHVDHRIALAAGGTNDVGNLVISCPACNLSKQAKPPWEWAGRLL